MPFDPNTSSYPLKDVARRAAAITPNNTTVYDTPVVVYVGSAGDIAVTDVYGTQVTFTAFPAGQILPLYVLSVKTTGTTASGLIGLS